MLPAGSPFSLHPFFSARKKERMAGGGAQRPRSWLRIWFFQLTWMTIKVSGSRPASRHTLLLAQKSMQKRAFQALVAAIRVAAKGHQ